MITAIGSKLVPKLRGLRFTVTMLYEPGKPTLVLVDDDELAQRKDCRAPRAS